MFNIISLNSNTQKNLHLIKDINFIKLPELSDSQKPNNFTVNQAKVLKKFIKITDLQLLVSKKSV